MNDAAEASSSPAEICADDAGRKLRRILWIAPNLNPYKAKFLDKLHSTGEVQITVLAGKTAISAGYRDAAVQYRFGRLDVPVTKQRFATHWRTYGTVVRCLRSDRYHTVVMPIEKKHLPLILFLICVRPFRRFRLVSYNHACLRGKGRRVTKLDLALSRFLFRRYDHIVFYTQQAREWAIDRGLIESGNCSYANNTLDTDHIWSIHPPQISSSTSARLLFIGRLVRSKRVDLLLQYYQRLKAKLPELQLDVIGDGPDASLIRDAAANTDGIVWHGAMTDERQIGKLIQNAQLVFVPGSSGLSIVHAFCYGRPYATIRATDFQHGPEIDYLQDGVNGLLLDGDLQQDVARIMRLFSDTDTHQAMANAALNTARSLSIDCWKRQMLQALQVTAHLP